MKKPLKLWHSLMLIGALISLTVFLHWLFIWRFDPDFLRDSLFVIVTRGFLFLGIIFIVLAVYNHFIKKELGSKVERSLNSLKRQDLIYHALIENIKAGVIFVEVPELSIQYANQEIKDLLGLESVIEDTKIWGCFPQGYLEQALQNVRMNPDIKTFSYDNQLITCRGELIYCKVVYIPIRFEDKTLLIFVVNDISEHIKSNEVMQKRASELAALYAMSRSLAAEQDLSALLGEVVDYATTLLNAPYAQMLLYDADLDCLELKVARGFNGKIGKKVEIGRGVVGITAQSLQSMIIDDYAKFYDKIPDDYDLKVLSIISVPMVFGGELIGVLEVFEVDPSTRKFTREECRLLDMFAGQAASAVHDTWLLEKTKRHLAELEVVAQISSILRTSQTIQEMLPRILDNLMGILKTKTALICLYNATQTKITAGFARGWLVDIQKDLSTPESLIKRILKTGKKVSIQDFANEVEIPQNIRMRIPPQWNGVIIPLPAAREIAGILIFAVENPREFSTKDMHILETLSEIAGGAIHRSYLFERTEQQLRRISALYSIDTIIRTSLDLNLILKILLDQVTTQLGVNAADILLYHDETKTLEFAAGLRFHSAELEHVKLAVGQDYAGKAIQEGRTIIVPDLSISGEECIRSHLLWKEGFVSYYCVPLISKGDEIGVLEIFNRSPLSPDSDWLEFLEAMAAQAAIALDNARLVDGLQKTNLELTMAYDTTIEGWVRAMDMRDEETEGHSQRVSEMTQRLARLIGIPENKLTHVRRGALLHDIGKMAVPDTILRKAGPLTPEEWVIMRKHPLDAYNMLSGVPFLLPAIDIPLCHHEKWDGSGYPKGLAGENIPLEARVFSIIDVWDALISDRPYRKAWPHEKALEYIHEQSGRHFDPKIVDFFEKFINEYSE